jgi:hypothetical protein
MARKPSAKKPHPASGSGDKQRPGSSIVGASNARPGPEFTLRLVKAHEEIHAAYCNALRETACTQARAARGMGVDPDTAANYEHGRTPVNVARVLAYPRLRKAFRRHLCGDHHDSLPGYVVSKKRRGSK